MRGSRFPGNVPADVDGVQQLLLALVAGGVAPRWRDAAVVLLAEHFWPAGYGLGHVLGREVDVEGDVLGDGLRAAVPQVADRLESCREVGARSVEGQGYRASPPVQEGLQVVQEGVVGMCRVCDALPTPELPIGEDVVVEDPVVAPLGSLLDGSDVETVYVGLDGLGGAVLCR